MKKVEIFSANCDDIKRLEKGVNDFLKVTTKFQPKVEWMQSSEERLTIITAIVTYNM